MENRPARTARGLSIATLVITIISIVSGIMICFAMIGFAQYVEAEYEKQDTTPEAVFREILDQTPELKSALEESGADVDFIINSEVDLGDVEIFSALFMIGLAIVGGLYLASIICALVASILGITRAKDPKRFTAALVWAVLAAVFSGIIALMCGGALILRLATMILCIIMAVYESKARKLANAPAAAYPNFQQPYGASPYGGAPVGYSPQPYGYQPQQGYGAPMQNMQNGYAQNTYAQNGYQQPYNQGMLPPFPQQAQQVQQVQSQAQVSAQTQAQPQAQAQDPYAPSGQVAQSSFEPEQRPLEYYTYPTDASTSDDASSTSYSNK